MQVQGVPAAERREKSLALLQEVGLEGLEDRRPAEMSGGQQQRVAVARALVFEPDLVLMDEPLGALDKNLREEMQFEIKHIHERLGVSVVYVTHDQSEALTMSNRIAVFNDGVVQQLAEPDVLYEQPENAFVAQFIGENNKLYGKVEDISGETAKVVLDSGSKVTALAVNTGGVGERTTLSIRPERVLLGDDGADNKLTGKVVELIYLGDHIRCRMEVEGHDDFIVKVPNSHKHAALKVGEETPIGWITDDCRALDVWEAA